ncbi:hypothetical protein [Polynucleobacter sp. UK-Kesae-W10]|uniref:hypothetical protein n=1 Tax=Polynucleobacter sp. UK-Kesae-W10 TaxID=1819738 RepID=UPI001C0B4CCE|nr:hypothetical protein [Polynucleobacter sp. UK-Kesae-W10]MBU3577544.1 hypothetical protein [Polynucleobacter sp. UK-Kesae-W10]
MVAPEYEQEYGEPHWGQPEEWREVFLTPPTVKLEAKVDELDKLITEKRAELKRINAELDQSGRLYQDQLKKLKQHQALQRIEDYMDGKFTHFLQVGYEIKLVSKEDALKSPDRYDSDMKLLTLFGSTKGDLQWRINRWGDGSGSETNVYPCESEDEAKEIVRKLYAEAVEEWRAQEKKHHGRALEWANTVDEDWIDVPQDVKNYLRDQLLDARMKVLEEAEKRLREAQENLADALAKSLPDRN